MGESRKGDFLQTRLRHVEDANLVAGTEAVLHAPQDAGVGGSVALHVQNRVHHVFERPGTRDVSCFRHMPGDENGCDRLGISNPNLYLLHETNIDSIVQLVSQQVDIISTLSL